MTNDLERRLEELEAKLSSQQADNESDSRADKSHHHRSGLRTSAVVMVISVVLIIGAGGVYWAHSSRSQGSSIPASIISQVDYKLYYPSKLPEGYSYVQSSAGISNGMVTYVIRNGNDTLTVTQQKAPTENVKLDSLPGFSPTGTPVGQAYIGTAAGQSVALIKTLTTMINITATGNDSKTVLADITSALEPTNE